MRHTIKRQFTKFMLASLASFFAVGYAGNAAPIAGVKTSQHASFKPENFERLAVIVKPVQGHTGIGIGMGRGHQQSQTERLIEQGFMRTLMAHGYTLVSRTDLDAAMVEKGLDQAHMTDEKFTEEAAKLLHVSALLIVSVDDYSVTPQQVQRQVTQQPGQPRIGYSGLSSQTVYLFAASLSARLVKIDDNMVMWTGDMTIDRTLANQNQDSQLLGSMGESIASSFPAFPAKKD